MCRKASTTSRSSLRFLGILPDEWWVTGGPVGPYVQSQRLPLYQASMPSA